MDELIKRLREKAGAFDYDGRPDIACDYEQAADAIEELSKPKWIPAAERLPREQETVLTWGKQGVILLDWWHDNRWCCFSDATHWMSLPEPPQEETE